MIDPNLLGPSTLAITSGVTAFSTFLPKISEVRKTDPAVDPSFAADVRMGEVAAVTLTLGIGAIVSSFTKSSAPVVTGAVISLTLIVIYESALRGSRPFEPKTKVADNAA